MKSKIIGIRHGEKMYETLLTKEEYANAKIWEISIGFQQISEI